MEKYIVYYSTNAKKFSFVEQQIAFQRNEVNRFCEKNNIEIVDEIVGIKFSGNTKKQKEKIQQQIGLLIQTCREHEAGILFSRLEFIVFNSIYTEEIIKRQIHVRAADFPPLNRENLPLLHELHKYKMQKIAEVSYEARLKGIAGGKRFKGCVPVKISRTKMDKKRYEEGKKIASLIETLSAAKYSMAEIARQLNKLGYKTTSGKFFTVNSVYRIKKNFKGVVIPQQNIIIKREKQGIDTRKGDFKA